MRQTQCQCHGQKQDSVSGRGRLGRVPRPAPGAPVCDRLIIPDDRTRRLHSNRLAGMNAQSRLQAGAPTSCVPPGRLMSCLNYSLPRFRSPNANRRSVLQPRVAESARLPWVRVANNRFNRNAVAAILPRRGLPQTTARRQRKHHGIAPHASSWSPLQMISKKRATADSRREPRQRNDKR